MERKQQQYQQQKSFVTLDKLQEQVIEQNNTIQKLLSELSSLRSNIGDVKEDLHTISFSLSQDITGLKSKLDGLDTNPLEELNELKKQVGGIQKELIDETKKVKSRIEAVNNVTLTQRAEFAKLKETVQQELEKFSKKQDESKNSLYELNSSVNGQLNELRIKSIAKEDIEKFVADVNKQIEEVSKTQGDLSKFTSRIQKHDTQLLEHSNEIRMQRHTNLRMEDKIVSTNEKHISFSLKQQEEILALRKLIGEKNQELKALKQMFNQHVDNQDKSYNDTLKEVLNLKQNLFEKSKNLASKINLCEDHLKNFGKKLDDDETVISKHSEILIRAENGLLEVKKQLSGMLDATEKKIEQENANNKAQILRIDAKLQNQSHEIVTIKENLNTNVYRINHDISRIKNALPYDV